MSGADLYAACKSGDHSRVKDLLSLDTLDINWKNTAEKDQTSLHAACQGGHLSVVEELLKSTKLDPNIKDASKTAPVDRSFGSNLALILKRLLQDPRVFVPELFRACALNQPDKVKELLSNAELNVNEAVGKGKTALYNACRKGHVDIVRLLGEDPRMELEQPTSGGVTPLEIAWVKRNFEVAHYLKKKRNLLSFDSMTPLIQCYPFC